MRKIICIATSMINSAHRKNWSPMPVWWCGQRVWMPVAGTVIGLAYSYVTQGEEFSGCDAMRSIVSGAAADL